jgi:hypothetical protein
MVFILAKVIAAGKPLPPPSNPAEDFSKYQRKTTENW